MHLNNLQEVTQITDNLKNYRQVFDVLDNATLPGKISLSVQTHDAKKGGAVNLVVSEPLVVHLRSILLAQMAAAFERLKILGVTWEEESEKK